MIAVCVCSASVRDNVENPSDPPIQLSGRQTGMPERSMKLDMMPL